MHLNGPQDRDGVFEANTNPTGSVQIIRNNNNKKRKKLDDLKLFAVILLKFSNFRNLN